MEDKKPAPGGYVYIVRCADNTLYTGWTTDVEARVKTHNDGLGAKYTKSRRPVTLLYSRAFPTKEEAMKEEWRIKHLTRKEKLALVKSASDHPEE